ncbi:hypothetical protein ACSZNG_12450 [Aeromonas hydrophila]
MTTEVRSFSMDGARVRDLGFASLAEIRANCSGVRSLNHFRRNSWY